MRVLLTDQLSHTEQFTRQLQAAMPDVSFHQWPLNDPSWDCDLLVSWQLPDDMTALPPGLKAIFCFGAGADRLLSDPRIPKDMPITRLKDDGQAQQMLNYVEHVALSWLQNENAYRLAQSDRVWLPHPGELRTRDGMHVTILGLGPLGEHAATGLAASGFKVSAWSRSKREVPNITTYAGGEELVSAARNADLLVNLLPLQPETHNILAKGMFEVLRPGAYVVNLGRGDHLNEEDLLTALNSDRIGCAWLDVFRQEPLPVSHPFWTHRKIRITPHMAAIPTPSGTSISIARVVEALQAGTPLPNLVR